MKASSFLALFCACLALSPRAHADSVVVFNEIMYHPPGTNEAALEWVELHNQMSVDVDLSGWRLDAGIDFRFAEGTIIPAGGYLVVASSPAMLQAMGVTNVVGPFLNRLSNAGDKLLLRNLNSRIMDEVNYRTEFEWPVAPDGAGPSLARRAPNLAGADAANWRASDQVGGTPGAVNFPVIPPQFRTSAPVGFVANWKYHDRGVDLGEAWRAPGYDDSTWASGPALFFTKVAELPAPQNTPLAPGRSTYYFRARFNVTGDVSRTELRLRPLIDDGAVFYLNGAEVGRFNMPDGPVNYATLAANQVSTANFGETLVIPTGGFRAGQNTLAVEVHQAPDGMGYAQAVLDSGPVAYWRLGESNGPAMDLASAPASPNLGSQDGIYRGLQATNLVQAGPRPSDLITSAPLLGFETTNTATGFLGNGDGGNDVITIPDPGVFNFASTRQFTLEAWVLGASGQEAGAAIIAKGTGGGGEQFAVDVVSGNYRFFGWDGGSPSAAIIASASVGPNGTWQHVVAVYDQPARRMKLYVNGVERGSGTPSPTLLSTSHEVSIGARKNAGSTAYDLNFNGRIDEVAIYSRALSTNEIVRHFQAALTEPATPGTDTNDVVFGLEVVAAELVQESVPLRVAFNELASSTNAAFWLELINHGATDAPLGGCVLARFGGTNREYALPPQTLAPGALLQITKAELGFGVDSGDRLVLYAPGRSNVLDAVVAKKEPRGRSPDAVGPWLFPSVATPGASNIVTHHDELVINEIMFHHRELPAEAATYSPTNVVLPITNVWRYRADAVDLGSDWSQPGYNDNGWLAGAAAFYAPTNPFVLPAPKNTLLPLSNEAGERILTYYFRTQFTFSGDTNALIVALRAIVDDGAVFYLNGAEVLRLNLPAGPIAYTTLSTTNVNIPDFAGPLVIPTSQLRVGLNTLAVEVHQASTNSSDADFAAELLAWNELTPALPFRDSPESWVEVFNRSSNAVSLAGWRLDEGIDYRFASNHVIAPRGFLVVAKDVAHMRSVYPGLDVVGPFTNRLSKRSDLIALKDPNNNPADEVHYFGRERWPRHADGGGSSLELRDPDADNSQPEAWAASDESGKSEWRTYSWRGLAAFAQSGEPTQWRELALCILDGAGEALLDDISVIETPATTPRQLISNSTFDSGTAARWRFMGNHRGSRVEPEPGNPGNHVLHLVAAGPGEYQGNQIETTLTNNTAIVNGREYEISFRAKWLAGKNKLNARLYFNRLPRTVDLAVPARNGSPGAPNSRLAPNIGPTFSRLSHTPAVPGAGKPVTVSVEASDPDNIAAMTLRYSVAGGAWASAAMTSSDGRLFSGTIPGQSAASIVQFYVEGSDGLGAVSLYPARGTNSRALYVVEDGQAVRHPTLHNFRLVMTTADATDLHTPTNTLSNELLGCTVIYDEREAYYDCGVRLKGSFVGRNVARVGFHVQFNEDQLFRGAHRVVSVDRSQHAQTGGIGEIIVKHIATHAGGIPDMHDDLAYFIGALPSYNTISQLRISGFDSDYLDAQFRNGSDGPMYEVEVLRWNLNTVGGNPEAPKQVGNESGGTGYANLEMQNWGDNKENYRWFLLQVNNRTADDYERGIAACKTLGLTTTNFDAQSRQVLDVDQWLRALAYQSLVGTADAYFIGANIHNFRLYVRPEDRKVLYMPWDWDSAFQTAPTAPLIGSGNVARLLTFPHNRRVFLNHLHDIVTRTFNAAYMSRWTTHYGAVASQNLSSIQTYINGRATYVLGQLPNAAAFAITNNGGENFGTNSEAVVLRGVAPIRVKFIEVNGVRYPITWTSPTNWSLNVPLITGTNLLVAQAFDAQGQLLTNAFDSITVTNTGPLAPLPIVINEWMADNAGPGGLIDPADGLYQDWFELYNPNAAPVNLAGMYLTDNLSVPTRWRIPTNTFISGRGFMLVWADGNTNQNPTQGGTDVDLHSNFSLNNGGEAIGLFATDGATPLSTVTFARQLQNVSQGRFPDGDTNSVHGMTNWSPRAANRLGTVPTPHILSFAARPDGTVALVFSSYPGRTYRVEYKDDLRQPAWVPLEQNHLATGASIQVTDRIANRPQRFYRVSLLP